MWRGCVDVMAIANMANMDIDVIVYEDGSEPELTHFQPDQKFPWKQEDPRKRINGQEKLQGKMTVLNWKNIPYNLIVGPSHILS